MDAAAMCQATTKNVSNLMSPDRAGCISNLNRDIVTRLASSRAAARSINNQLIRAGILRLFK